MRKQFDIFNLKTGIFIETNLEAPDQETALKKAHEKHVGGEMPPIVFGLVTASCGDLCLLRGNRMTKEK